MLARRPDTSIESGPSPSPAEASVDADLAEKVVPVVLTDASEGPVLWNGGGGAAKLASEGGSAVGPEDQVSRLGNTSSKDNRLGSNIPLSGLRGLDPDAVVLVGVTGWTRRALLLCLFGFGCLSDLTLNTHSTRAL